MKPYSNNHEILLLTTSSFSHRQLCERNDTEKKSNLSPNDELEAACWNGLLEEMLPEVLDKQSCTEKTFLWQVEKGSSYLKISMATYPHALDEYYTLDPYIFFEIQNMN